ncbi:MAG: TCR/Tet family MFS transporter [Alphaproteobacteria bacterium]|nr:TCR/Tet family MFS transporter [Alphaproteobacteria bacterium]
MGTGLAYPILPRLIEQFQHGNVSHASYVFGLLASAFAVTQFLFAPIIGAISDRYGRRPVILLSLAGSAISYALMAAAPSLIFLALGRLLAGMMGGSFSTAQAYLADITPPEKRSQTFGLIGAAFGLGFITGPAIGGVLGHIDLQLPFLVAGVLCAADVVFAFFALPETLSAEHRKPFNWRHANPIGALRHVGRYGQVAMLMAIYVMSVFANRCAEMVWVLYTGYRFHWGTKEVGISLAVVGLVFVFGQGWFSRFLIPRLGERRAIVLGLGASVLISAGYGLVTQGWMLFIVMPFAIFGWIAAQPAVQGVLSRSVPQNEQGLLQGAMASMTSLTSVVGPMIWTGLFGYFVSPAAPLILPGAAFFASAAIFLIAFSLAVRWEATTPLPVGAAPSS